LIVSAGQPSRPATANLPFCRPACRTLSSSDVDTLDQILREHNRNLVPAAQVRIRIAIDTGLVHLDGANGFPGDATNAVSRLVDAPALKHALASFPEAGAALIVSDLIYREVVRNYCDDARQKRFARVTVRLPEKDFQSTAWIFIPQEDVTTLDDLDQETALPAVAAAMPTAQTAAPGKFNIGSNTVNGTQIVGDHAKARTAVRGGAAYGRRRTDVE
jgi:hypothetical protein